MPMGNGDIGSNIWVSPGGNLHLLLSKTDAMSEIGRLLKIGELEIAMQPNILAGSVFKQELILEKGMIRITGKNGQKEIVINLWVNASLANNRTSANW
jgi:hypothetical protein